MNALGLTECRNCKKEIKYSSLTGWTHTTTQSVFCDAGADWKALPKPKRLAEPRR